MNAAHVHLAVNHFPLFVSLFGVALLLVGILRRQDALTRVGLICAVLAGMGAVVATRSGEAAEDIVEEYPGVLESAIHDHEEAAETAQWAAVLLGVLGLTALAVPAQRASIKRGATFAALAVALVAFGLIARAANLGGMIRHPEISAPGGDLDAGSEDEERHDGGR